MGSGTRTRYNVALDGRGFILRGSPQNPAYSKSESGVDLTKVRPDDPEYNPLNGADWSYWAQTDWSGGFQQLKWKDNATFRDGRAVDVLRHYGDATIQHAFNGVVTITGGFSFGAYGLRQTDMLFGVHKTGLSRIWRTSAAFDIVSPLSSIAGISGVNSMSPFKSALLIGLSRTSGTLKTLMAYDRFGGNLVLSGIRNANPIVRSVKGIGIRAYTGEKVASLSGDVLYYSTDLATFTSAYQTGKGDKIKKIEDLNGTPYFFVEKGNVVEMYRFDEYQSKALLIYTFSDLTSWGTTNYLTSIIIGGTSNGKRVAFAFNGARLQQIFTDQLEDTSFDFSRPLVYEDNLHFKGAAWDGSAWVPGLYHAFGAFQATPFANRTGSVYAYATSGTRMEISKLSSNFRASGYVIGSDFGHDIGQVDKLVNSVTVNCAPLSGGHTIEIFRSSDEGRNFASVGKLSYARDGAISSKVLYYPSGFVAKKYTYKATMATVSAATTPVLKDVIHQYRTIPDTKMRWGIAAQALETVQLLNGQREQRDGIDIASELWMMKQRKKPVVFEDLVSFSGKFISAMSKTATSARVNTTKNMPRRGRLRVVSAGVAEEMTYLTADGKRILGITRGVKGTNARNYTSANRIDNHYTVLVTDIRESVVTTDEEKTEAYVTLSLLEV